MSPRQKLQVMPSNVNSARDVQSEAFIQPAIPFSDFLKEKESRYPQKDLGISAQRLHSQALKAAQMPVG